MRNEGMPLSESPAWGNRGFTLIELLVVISIIALLIAILLPVLSSVRYESTNFLCLNRQRQWTIAAHAYCTDNKEFYPDRGIDNFSQGEAMWARWAARMWINQSTDDNLDDVLGDYMSEAVPVWVCPQYDGAHGTGAYAGCLQHGKGHYNGGNQNNYRWTTYSFHGGLNESLRQDGSPYANSGPYVYNPGGRRRIGERYIIELRSDGSKLYESGLLISDTASDDNVWVPSYYPNTTGLSNSAPFPGIAINHQPKPGTLSQQIGPPGFRIQGVGGPAHTNWAYDDGSAETRLLTPSDALLSSDEWFAARDGARYMMFPKR